MPSSSRALIVLLLCAGACATVQRAPAPVANPEMSGFLDDYSLLQPGESGLVYRNPTAHWTRYDKVLLEPVTLWRSGRRSLAPVPDEELMHLIGRFQDAVRRRLGEGFAMVAEPGPGVMRIRLAITEARASDPVLDVLEAHAGDVASGKGALHPEMRRFLEHAAVEGEIRDAASGELLAQGVERRREGAVPLATWADVERALDAWVERVCSRLEARTGRR